MKRRGPFLATIAALALFGSGCVAIQSPEGWAAPVQVDDQVLVQSSKGQVSLVTPGGGVAWTFPAEDSQSHALYATPIVDGSTVYLADYDGRVTRLNVGSGQPEQVWVAELGYHVVATPVLDGDELYVPTADGRIVVLSTGDGATVETLRTSDQRIWGAPAFREDTLYVGDLDDGETVALNVASGDVEWEQSISGPTAADMVLDGDLLLAGAFDQHLHALEAASGEERWAFAGDGWFLARPVVHEGVVYAATMTGSVYAIDRETGQERWSFLAEDAQFRAAPVVHNGNLIAVARDGRVFALDLASGEVAWQQDATLEGNVNANPLIVGDNIYLVTSQHDLVRVDAANDGAFQAVPLAADQ